jgi:hypothetical protein
MPITQQQLQAWRDAYQQQVEASLLAQPVSTEREKRRTSGQTICLMYFIQSLDFLEKGELTPKQMEVEIDQALAKLADTKIYYLIEYVRCPQQRNAVEEDIWWAEGILLQIDRMCEDLLKVLPAEWKPDRRAWGHYYQLYHYRDFCPFSIDEVALHWQDPDRRGQVFEEVGFVQLDRNGEVLACLDAVFECSNSIEEPWTWNKEAYWIRPGERPRSTSIGDVIIPGLGEAWMVDRTGFRLLPNGPLQPDQPINQEQPINYPSARRPSGILARLKKVWLVLFPDQTLK